MRTLVLSTITLPLATSLAEGQAGSGTTTLNLTVSAEAGITVNTTPNLTESGNFAAYTGSTSFTYYIRTGASGGSGNIMLEVTTDFSPVGGPSVATPPTTGDALQYTCTVADPGNNGTATACTGSVTSSTTAQTSVATFGADARSALGGNAGSVNWTLTNDPKYKTGSYSATVTFTVSAT